MHYLSLLHLNLAYSNLVNAVVMNNIQHNPFKFFVSSVQALKNCVK